MPRGDLGLRSGRWYVLIQLGFDELWLSTATSASAFSSTNYEEVYQFRGNTIHGQPEIPNEVKERGTNPGHALEAPTDVYKH